MPATETTTQQTRTKEKNFFFFFKHYSLDVSYSDEITFPVLITTKEANDDKDDMEEVGSNG